MLESEGGGGRDGVSSHSNVKNDFSLSRENIQNFGKSPSSPSHDFVLYPSNDFHEYSTVNLSIQNYPCRTLLIKSTINNHPLKLWPSLGFHEKCSNNEKGREERSKQPALHCDAAAASFGLRDQIGPGLECFTNAENLLMLNRRPDCKKAFPLPLPPKKSYM